MSKLKTTLSGKLTFKTTMDGFSGKEMVLPDAKFKLEFSADRTVPDPSNMDELAIPIDDGPGSRILKVRYDVTPAPGRFDPGSGLLVIPVGLIFDVPGLPALFDSNLELELTTESVAKLPGLDALAGKRAQMVDGAAAVTLVGAGTFVDGHLDGERCSIVIEGRIAPGPFP